MKGIFRIIDDTLCWCYDTGVDDPERAALNRYIIKERLFTTPYQIVESAVAHTPLKQPLASWIPSGTLPTVGRKDWQQHGGDKGGDDGGLEFVVVEA